MKRYQVSVIIVLIVLSWIAFFSLLSLTTKKINPLPSSSAPVQFDTKSAMGYIEGLSVGFPYRSEGSDAYAAAARWLADTFRGMGLDARIEELPVVVGGKDITGLDVVAESPGRTDEIIVVTGHFDVPAFVSGGAADDASGVGVMLEIARIFSKEPHEKTLVFVADGGEEYGMWGARGFIDTLKDKKKVAAVIDLDFAHLMKPAYFLPLFAGTHRGYTPPTLRETTLAGLAGGDLPIREVSPVFEYLDRTIPIAVVDAGSYLGAGIPAVNLGVSTDDPEYNNVYYHTEKDVFASLEEAPIKALGEATERIVLALDENPLPAESMYYLKVGAGRYAPGWAVRLAQLILFAPLFAATAFLIMNRKKGALASFWDESKAYAGAVGALLFGYVVLLVLPEVGLLVKYDLYPATMKDPFLYHPRWLPIVLTYGSMVLVGIILWRFTPLFVKTGKNPADRRAFLTAALAVISLLTWAVNGFAATLLLILPATLWIWIGPGRSKIRIVGNLALLVGGTVVFAALLYFFPKIYYIGPIWWYLSLAAAYGLVTPAAVVLFLMTLGLLIRLLALSFARTGKD